MNLFPVRWYLERCDFFRWTVGMAVSVDFGWSARDGGCCCAV